MSNQTIAFYYVFEPSAPRECLWETIIKRDMNGKNCLKKKNESEHGFNWCLPVVWPLFPSPSFFCLSASLGLIRPAVESGSLGKHSRVWLELRLKEAEIGAGCGGGGGASWGASTSDHFPHAIHHAVWSIGRPPPALQPSSSSPPSFISFLSILLFFLGLLFPPALHHPTFFSYLFYSTSCCLSFCRRKQTVTFGNDSLQTSALWHHNKSRNSSTLPSFYHFERRLEMTVQGLR